MTQEQRLNALIELLLEESAQHQNLAVPQDAEGKRRLLRALMNIRPPLPAAGELLALQDEYLQAERAQRGIETAEQAEPTGVEGLYIWQGDITCLAADAIVNAANSALLGCFIPGHSCIDNAIHSAAGIQLRLACNDIMQRQGTPEATGHAKITPGFNLPAKHVLHTVGPVIHGPVTPQDCTQLAACYTSCLTLATQHKLGSIAFCCISTGEFHFPAEKAAEIAVQTVKAFIAVHSHAPRRVIFNVFQYRDYAIYKRLLG